MKKKITTLLFLLVLVLPCLGVSALPVFAEQTHTVTFTVDGEVYATDTVADGKTIKIIPATPVKNGSVFEYWELDGQKFSFTKPITGDVELKAKWDEKAVFYKVQFMVDDKVISTQEVESGRPAVAPANPELPNGKAFVRWDTDFSSVVANLIVNAILEDKAYTVSVYGFNGVLYDLIRVVHGENVSLPQKSQVPEVPHYTFTGYDFDGKAITQDTEIHMIYTPDVYTVTFESEGATFCDAQQVEYGRTAKFPTATPAKDNYIFIGWYKEDSDVLYDFNEKVEESINLVARFIPKEKPKYEVTFYTHDNIQYGGTQIVEEGQSAIVPGNPSRYGYTFIAWSEDFSSVTKDLAIYPLYSINEYSVEFICDGEILDAQTVRYGDSASEPQTEVPEKTGYDFIGWDRQFKNITGDMEIHAIYRVKTFAVMFYDENNRKIGATQYVEYGESAVSPKLSEKVGYTFLGWSDGISTSEDAYKTITDDVTFIAEYSAITYSIEFYEGAELKYERTVKHGDYVPLYAYDKTGFLFVGWYVDQELTNAFDFTTGITGDVKLYAKWQEKPVETFTVTFYVDRQVFIEQTVGKNQSAIAPGNPEKEGHSFIRWDKDFSDITSNLAVNAVFEKKEYTVTFYYGDNDYKQIKVEYGEDAVAPTEDEVQKVGYNFSGWSQGITSVSSDLVVYAKYDRITLNVTFFNGNDQIAVQNLYYGEYAKVVSTPSKTGHTFEGWYIDQEFTTPFNFGTPITENISIYAKFTVNEYSVIYYLDGVKYQTVSVKYGAEIIPVGDPEFDDDRIFLGWSEIPNTMPAQNVVVTGSSKILSTYGISYYVNSTLIETVYYKEGQAVEPYGTPANLPETIVFNGWEMEPEVMPAFNLKIYADVDKLSYYSIYYYVNGQFNVSQMVLQGKPVNAPQFPQGSLPENVVFNGWINVPETMPASHIRIDADITLLNYYIVRYYIDGYARFIQHAVEGKEFKVMSDPSNALQEDTIFNYWTYVGVRVESGQKIIMPSNDVEIHANVTKLKYYNIRYYIGDLLYYTRTILQGKEVSPFETPSSLPENIIFYSWVDEPTVMPANDVTVTADYKQLEYYKLSFYVGERFYCTLITLEGATFSLPDAPTDLPENIIFNFWIYDGDFVMPKGDLTIYADYTELQEYVISYYINGVLYQTQNVLEGKPIEVIAAPTETPENVVFISWGDVPEIMPGENISVDAEIRILLEYDLNYYVNGVLYRTFKVLEGKAVIPLGEPYDQPDNIVFNGWINEPEIMPDHNVDVNADITILKPNTFVVNVSEVKDGKVSVTVKVTGLVKFAGFIGEVIYDSSFTVTDYEYDTEKGYVYGEDNFGRIVWSQGVNTTEEITLITLEFDVAGATDISDGQITFDILEIVVIDDNGNVINAEYSVEYKI